MDIDSFASQNAFELMQGQLPEGGRDQTIALVDVGASMMNINVLRNDQSVYMREQPFGGNQLTQEIMRHYNLSPGRGRGRQAQRRAAGHLRLGSAGSRSWTRWRSKLRAHCSSSSPPPSTTRFTISSSPAARRPFPVCRKWWRERTQVNTLVANPFVGMEVSSKVRQAPACGGFAPRCWLPADWRCGDSTNDPNQPTAAPCGAAQGAAAAVFHPGGNDRGTRRRDRGGSARTVRDPHREPTGSQQISANRDRSSSTSRSTRSRSSRSRRRRCWRASASSNRCRPTAPRPCGCSTRWCGSCRMACI